MNGNIVLNIHCLTAVTELFKSTNKPYRRHFQGCNDGRNVCKKRTLQNYRKKLHKNYWPGCPPWKLLIDFMFEPVHSKRRRSLPFSLLEKPVNSIIRKRSNRCHFHCLAGNSIICFFKIQPFFSLRSIH